jgi:hypothetical protein
MNDNIFPDEPPQGAQSVGEPSTPEESFQRISAPAYEKKHGKRDLYVFRWHQMCPLCFAKWIWDAVAAPEDVDMAPDPVRQGLACLCGSCEVKRIAFVVAERMRFPGTPAIRFQIWSETIERKAWGQLRHNVETYRPRVERSNAKVEKHHGRNVLLEGGRFTRLKDDKSDEVERVFRRSNGSFSLVVTLKEAEELGYDFGGYQTYEAPQKGSQKPKADKYAGGTRFIKQD